MNRKIFIYSLLFFLFAFYIRFAPENLSKFYFQADSTFYLRALNQFKKYKTLKIEDSLFVRKKKRTFEKIAPPLLIYSAYLFEKLPYINLLNDKEAISTFNSLWGAFVSLLFFLLLFYISKNINMSLIFAIFFSVSTPFLIKSCYLLFRGETPSISFFVLLVLLLYKIIEKDRIVFTYKIFFPTLFLLGMGFWRLFPLLVFPFIFGIIVERHITQKVSIYTLHTIFFLTLLGLNLSLIYGYYRINITIIFIYNIVLFTFIIYQLISEKLKRNRKILKIYLYFPVLIFILLIVIRFYRYYTIKTITNSLNIYERGVEELLPVTKIHLSFYLLTFIGILLIAFLTNIKNEIKNIKIHIFFIPYFIFLLSAISFKRVEPYAMFFMTIILFLFYLKLKNKKIKKILISFTLIFSILLTYNSINKISPYPDQNLPEVFNYIRNNIANNVPIVSIWGYGYEIEYYTNHPAITDGYLEDKITRERIIKFSNVLFSGKELELISFLKRFKSKYLLLNKTDYNYVFYSKGNVKYKYIKEEKKGKKKAVIIKKKGMDINILKLLFLRKKLKFFKPLFEKGNYVIIELKSFH